MKIRLKVPIQEAKQFNPEDGLEEIIKWTDGAVVSPVDSEGPPRLFSEGIGGMAKALPGDYVVKGPEGRFHTFTPNKFDEVFEVIGE
jgi:hypothetical protein